MANITIPSPRTVLTPTGFDIKLQNYYVDGGTVVIETIPQYLARVTPTVRTPACIVALLIPKEGYVLTSPYPINNFATILANFDLAYYHFKGGIANENFVAIEFGSAIFNTYEAALKSGYIGTPEQWIYLSGATTYEQAVERGYTGTEEDWILFVNLYARGPIGLSAYEIAVQEGFVGNVTAWLDSLKGADGNNASVGYVEYRCLLSQVSTANPTAIVNKNDIGAIAWTRIGVGVYRATSAGLFVADHTSPVDDLIQDKNGNLYTLEWIDANTMELRTYAAADITVLADGILNKRYINICVSLLP